MKPEFFSSSELVLFRPHGEISRASVAQWNETFYRYYKGQLKLMMDFRALQKVSISVPEFTSIGLADRARAHPSPDLKVAYVTGSELIYGFARVIENVWHATVDVTIHREFDSACDWFGIDASVWNGLELQVRAE